MRHQVFGKKLGRTRKERTSLFRLLVEEFILNDQLKTSKTKAKAVRSIIEHFVTKAKIKSNHIRQYLYKETGNKNVVEKLFQIGKFFTETKGGYLRILNLGTRSGDNSEQVLMKWSKQPVFEVNEKVKKAEVVGVGEVPTVKVKTVKSKKKDK